MFRRESKLHWSQWQISQRFTGKKFQSAKCSGALHMKGKFCFGEFQLLRRMGEPWSHHSISCYLKSNLSSSLVFKFDVHRNQSHKSEHSWTLKLFELQSGSAFANVLYLYNTGQAKSSIWVLLKRGGSARKFCSASPNLISSHRCILLFGCLSVCPEHQF